MRKEDIIIGTPVWYYPFLKGKDRKEAVISSGPYEMCGTVCCKINISAAVVCIDNLEKR